MKTLIIFAFVALSAFTANAQKVKVASNPGTDFSKYKTYAWDQGMMSNPLIKQNIMAAVDSALAGKGLRQVQTEPDLILSALAATESDLTVTNPSWAPQLNSIATGIPASSQAWPVTKGTLLINISDAKTKDEVWRATATHTLENGPTGDRIRDAKSVQKPIQKAIQKMFKNFPPQSNN